MFAKPWWDQDLAAAENRVSKAQREQKHHHHNTINTFSRDIKARIRKVCNYFKQLCQIKKQD